MPQTPRYFVSLDAQGRPLFQRSTLRERPYLSASDTGFNFSSSPPRLGYPRKVVQVAKPIEWLARATLPDGTKVTDRSKSGPPGRNFIRYSFVRNGYNVKHGAEPTRVEQEVWTNQTPAQWLATPGADELDYILIASAIATLEIRNWPSAGDSVVLPDVAVTK